MPTSFFTIDTKVCETVSPPRRRALPRIEELKC
jgi:hypothetical protein